MRKFVLIAAMVVAPIVLASAGAQASDSRSLSTTSTVSEPAISTPPKPGTLRAETDTTATPAAIPAPRLRLRPKPRAMRRPRPRRRKRSRRPSRSMPRATPSHQQRRRAMTRVPRQSTRRLRQRPRRIDSGRGKPIIAGARCVRRALGGRITASPTGTPDGSSPRCIVTESTGKPSRYCPVPAQARTAKQSSTAPMVLDCFLFAKDVDYFETVCTTLDTGRVLALAPGSFRSFASASSYSGSVASCVLALICTTL